jgi:hypothetical protein
MSELCWLIEAPGQNYLAAASRKFFWTRNAEKALHFQSYKDADEAMMAIRELDKTYTIFAFAETLGDARPIEHGFIDAILKETGGGDE